MHQPFGRQLTSAYWIAYTGAMITHTPRPTYEPNTPLQEFLREVMREHCLSQSKLAQRLNIAPTNISNYLSNERRKRIVPSAETLDKLARYFDVDPVHLRRLAGRPFDDLRSPVGRRDELENSIPALIDGIIVRLEALKRLLAPGSPNGSPPA